MIILLNMKLFAGVDGGGSKTRAVVLDETLRVLGRGDGGPSNISARPIEAVREAIGGAVEAALREAGATLGDILQFGFGLAGAESTTAREILTNGLLQQFRVGRITLVTDARAALAGAVVNLSDPGMILIAGTGSVAYGRNAMGAEARAGGLGWLIGDEGSGFWIARRALEAVARAYDGRGAKTKMLEILCARHDICKVEDLIQYVYRPELLPSNVAAMVPVAIEAARAGDGAAIELFQSAAKELSLLLETVIKKLHLEKEDFSVATLGGLWAAGELLTSPIERSLVSVAPKSKLQNPAHPAEVGAARLAMADYYKIN